MQKQGKIVNKHSQVRQQHSCEKLQLQFTKEKKEEEEEGIEQRQQEVQKFQDETSQGQQENPVQFKFRKVRFSGLPKVPQNQQEDYSISCVGVLDQSLSNLIQENELKRKCEETSICTEFQDQNCKQMIQRRLDVILELKQLYKEQQWALYDELMLAHKQFCTEGKNTFKKRKYNSREEKSKQVISGAQKIQLLNQEQQSDCVVDGVVQFEDMERLLVQSNWQIEDAEYIVTRVEAAKSTFQDRIARILYLEQQIAANWCRRLSKYDAVAALVCRSNIYYICKPYVILGRDFCKDVGGQIDININNIKISRRQADIEMLLTGNFKLTRIGRREMIVDNQLVARGASVALKHQSLIEVGGDEMLFIVNQVALDKVQSRNFKNMQKS